MCPSIDNKITGKRLTSYGGYLTYSIFYTIREDGHAIAAADVIIGGANGFIYHNSVEQPPSLENWLHSVRIIEEEFTNLDGSAVTRDQFMNVLANITSIYIRATYWHEAVTTRYVILPRLYLISVHILNRFKRWIEVLIEWCDFFYAIFFFFNWLQR